MCAISAVVAMPPSTSRAGAGAWTIGPSQARQAYLGRIVRSTRSHAGTRSSASLVSSPIRCIWPVQHGQSVEAGSITCSTRGRCAGSAPMLRRALRRFGLGAPFGSSSLAGGCTSTVRSRSNASCSAQMIAERSDRAPKIRPFNVAICARRSSFSPSKASTISARAAGSEGRSSGRIAMSESYTKTPGIASKTRRLRRLSSAVSSPSGPRATTPRDPRSASPVAPPSRASSPSRTGGQAKPPSSSHLVANTSPVPSKTKIFKRSDRFERKTKTSPL